MADLPPPYPGDSRKNDVSHNSNNSNNCFYNPHSDVGHCDNPDQSNTINMTTSTSTSTTCSQKESSIPITSHSNIVYTTTTTSSSSNNNRNNVTHQFQPKVTEVQVFRQAPVFTNCPSCYYDIVTNVHFEAGSLTVLLCVFSAVAGCFLGCCLIPFFINGCKDVVHTCPKCAHNIARWSRM